MNWAGEYVSTKLDVRIDNVPNQILNIEDTVGLALRNNPKRAHLLVSKVLGKHIPVPASLIIRSGQILALRAYNALNGHTEPVEEYLGELKECLDGSIQRITSSMPAVKPVDALVVGYAETATSLGHIVAEYLKAPYIHSSRYGDENIVPYGKFEESHSHATTHKLLPKDNFFDNSLPMVLVDDELSTGKTIIATIEELQALSAREHYVVCTLIDCRSDADKQMMDDFASKLGVRIDVVYLAAGAVSYPSTILEDVKPVIASIPENDGVIIHHSPVVQRVAVDFTGYDDAKYGLRTFENEIAKNIVTSLDIPEGRILVLGTEEFMYLPVQVAFELEKQGTSNVLSSSTTRSPVIPFDDEGYAIRNRITYCSFDNDKKFAYNINRFDTVIIVVDPSFDGEELLEDNGLVENLGFTEAKNVILVEQRKNSNV